MLEHRLDGDKLTLTGELQVTFVERLKDALQEASLNLKDLEIDLSGVTDIDTAGLQMLLAFLREHQAQATVRLTGPTGAFLKALKLTGLNQQYDPFLA